MEVSYSCDRELREAIQRESTHESYGSEDAISGGFGYVRQSSVGENGFCPSFSRDFRIIFLQYVAVKVSEVPQSDYFFSGEESLRNCLTMSVMAT